MYRCYSSIKINIQALKETKSSTQLCEDFHLVVVSICLVLITCTGFISESTTTPTKTPSILNVSTKDLSSTAVISVTKTERAVVTTGQVRLLYSSFTSFAGSYDGWK